MTQIGEISVPLTAETSGFTGGIGQAVDTLGDFGSVLGTTRGSVLALGTAGAAVAAGGLAAATTQAAEFERTIAGAAARAGATEQAFNRFGEAAKQASLDSAFGANEAGQALRFLAKSGFETQEATEALPGILRGATAAGMGAAEMGEIASNALRQFNRSASETEEVMDVLVAASTNANTSVQELGQGLSVVGGLAAEAGMSIEETSALFANLQDAGIGASRAATAMRAGISKLLKPTDEANATLDQLGVNVKDSSGEFRGMIDVIADLEKAGASAEDMLAIFGRRAGPTLQTALSQGGGALKSFESEMQNADGTSRDIASFIRSSLTEQLKVLGGSLQTLGANIGEIVLPVLKALVAAAQGLVSGLNAVIDVVKETASLLGGGFLVSHEEAAGAVSDTKDEVDEANQSLETHKRVTREAAKENIDLKNKTSELRSEIEELEKQIDDQTKSILDRAMAQGELNEKQRELREELAKQRGKAKPVLLEQIRESQEQIAKGEKRLDNVRESLQALREEFGVEEGAPIIEFARAGASQETLDFIGKLRNRQQQLNQGLEKEREILDEAQQEYGETVDLQREVGDLAEDRKRQIDEQFEGLRRQTEEMQRQTEELSKHEKFMQAFERSEVGRQAALEQAQERLVGQSTGGRLGEPQSPLSDLSGAERNRMMARMSGGGGGVGAKQQQEALDQGAEFLSSMGENAEESANAAQQAQQLTGQVGSLTGALGKAADVSDQAQQAIGGVSGALQSVMGGIASGGPAGIASGIIGGITSLVQGIAGGGTTSGASKKRDQKRFADMLATRIADEQERRGLQPVEINVAGRSRGTQRRQRSDREQLEAMDEQEKLKGVGLGG